MPALSIMSRVRPEKAPAAQPDEERRGSVRRVLSVTLTVLAAVLVYLALVVPDNIDHHKDGVFVPGGFLRLPLEAIVGGAILISIPARFRRLVAALLGLGLGGLVVIKILNAGFLDVLGRRFNPVLDWSLFHDGFNALTETNGRGTAIGAAIAAILLSLAILVLVTLAVVRLAKVTARYAGPARRTLVGLTAVWVALALTGVTLYPNNPVAADSAAALAKTTAKAIPAAIRDEQAFNQASHNDPYAAVPANQRLAGLDGKDFVISVVESYGRSALTTPGMKAIVEPVLTQGTQTLAAKGYYAKSGWLTSSTFGGGSWLAHGSFQSGLWIDSTQRYRQLIASNRLTITSAFHQAGWQTYGFEPGNTTAWPEAKFYGYDTVYDSRNIGYKGPKFGWSSMPDQYTLTQFQKDVYGKPHAPLMAEITMTSSHEPWTPVPHTIGWDQVGDGSIYGPMAAHAQSKVSLWKSSTATQTAYAGSIAYSVNTLISWVEKYGDDNLVLVFFGDHQPFSIVSGNSASHQIPITVVAHDKNVLNRIADWNWTDGLEPSATAPVWQMSDFRNKFFNAYGSEPAVKQAR
jgi:hypothetical protein